MANTTSATYTTLNTLHSNQLKILMMPLASTTKQGPAKNGLMIHHFTQEQSLLM
jgi:hypothetical protein